MWKAQESRSNDLTSIKQVLFSQNWFPCIALQGYDIFINEKEVIGTDLDTQQKVQWLFFRPTTQHSSRTLMAYAQGFQPSLLPARLMISGWTAREMSSGCGKSFIRNYPVNQSGSGTHMLCQWMLRMGVQQVGPKRRPLFPLSSIIVNNDFKATST